LKSALIEGILSNVLVVYKGAFFATSFLLQLAEATT
jgi:hypothetical protein